MKIDLVYPKIHGTKNFPAKNCIVFEKLDGTNIHFVIQKGRWTDFGTRRDRFPSGFEGEDSFRQAHPELSAVLDNDVDFLIILDEFIKSTPKYYEANEVILFMEWCGPKSFAGQHQPNDNARLYLFDVQINGRILPPEEFLEDFKGFENYMPRVIYKGVYSGQLIEDIRKGKYNVKEGVVIKGIARNTVCMAKVKTDAYLNKLREAFKDDWKNYWE